MMSKYKHKTKIAEQYEGFGTTYLVHAGNNIPVKGNNREHARNIKRYLEKQGHKDVVIIQSQTVNSYIR